MRGKSRPSWIVILGGIVATGIVLIAIWAVAPEEVRGLLMLGGGALTVAGYLALFAIEWRRHWGS